MSRKLAWGEKRRYKDAEKPMTKATGMPANNSVIKMNIIIPSDMAFNAPADATVRDLPIPADIFPMF